jgi:tetratricopeptide (TPR) repeat protein
MVKNRILLVVAGLTLIVLLYFLPRSVVRNAGSSILQTDSVAAADPHVAPPQLKDHIRRVRRLWTQTASAEKNAIFADSLSGLYREAGTYDSAAWFADTAAAFYNTPAAWRKAGEAYYQAYTFAVDEQKQQQLAGRAQYYLGKVLQQEPGNLEVKCQLAMTYLSSAPMQGVTLLREVLDADPKNQTALFNLGMLAIQSGQYERAAGRLEELLAVNPAHTQGRLLLGVAYMNLGRKRQAREQFELIKKADPDPAVQATVDSYLKDLR